MKSGNDMQNEQNNLNCNLIDISQGWQLGWCQETTLNKWIQVFGFWKIEDDSLKASGFCPQIYANIEPKDDYIFDSTVCINTDDGEIGVLVKRSPHRISYYDICLKPGAQVKIRYIYYSAPDSVILENIGPVIESGREYNVRLLVGENKVKVYVDDELTGQFDDTFPVGLNPGFRMSGKSTGYFKNVKLTDISTKNVIFEDKFKQNSLARNVPVDLSELVSKEWIPADIPGSVHSSLLQAGKIEDPYIGYNGPKQQWIDNQRWIYKKKFTVPPDWKEKDIKLLFEGVDYHGYFWLNGKLLGYHEGMFGGPEYDISSCVDRNRANDLVVCLLPCPSP